VHEWVVARGVQPSFVAFDGCADFGEYQVLAGRWLMKFMGVIRLIKVDKVDNQPYQLNSQSIDFQTDN
jgi:hypothetical protein